MAESENTMAESEWYGCWIILAEIVWSLVMTAILEGERGVNVGILVSSKTRPGHVPGVMTPAGPQSTALDNRTGTASAGL